MKPTVYILFICLFGVALHIRAQHKVDSLTYYYQVVGHPESNSQLAKAYNFFKQHKNQSLQKKDIEKAVFDLRLLASIEKKMGLLSDSEISSVEALELLGQMEDSEKIKENRIGIYNHLGIVYRSLDNPSKALEFYNKSLELVEDESSRATLLNNIGNLYLDKNEYTKALMYFEEAYDKSPYLSLKMKARVLDNLGVAQSKLNLPEALPNLLEALSIKENSNYVPGIITSYSHLSDYYLDIGDKEVARDYGYKALDLAKILNNPQYLESALSTLMLLNGTPEVVQYKKLKDSLEKARRNAKDNFEYYRYQFSEQQRLFEESEFKRQKLFMLLVLVVLVFIAVYFVGRIKHNKEKLQKVFETETRISKKVHDEVANDVYQIMTKLQSSKETEEVLDHLEAVYRKTRDISKENSEIDVGSNFGETLMELLKGFHTEDVRVLVQNISKVEWKLFSNLQKATIYRVLQELMVNMRKHSKATYVVLKFKQNGKRFQIQYTDNGVGTELCKKNGLQNTENRIKSIKGSITFETDNGAGFKALIRI
ncbi:tetratricopeptide repeat-containing sensor histidine kinase [Mangrovimonas sp. TPBH4]|uniref:tetratricopeptide repeat-containing sensor histidine kinase n=1 Tax=Mangrovimonas sp. TPBH4 TaxID=1645914 RepID=UPI0006B6108E|nr:tetratricopeptide repeat-containing sensor histidine kinase [Mangrovimonas sp. TPBH4]